MNIIDGLKKAVGRDAGVLVDQENLVTYGGDWSRGHKVDPVAVVLPTSTEEVSQVMQFCSQNNIKVVPSGGRTGLAGGAVADDKQVILSLEKMNQIQGIDLLGMSLSCESGATTQALQEVAAEHGLFFPLDLAAKGSSQIGGNIATNAGGLNAIKYGMARQMVLGLEVVLANGEVLDLNSNLLKDNTGYDLKQLFIGSEGTLGVITKATLKLHSQPKNSHLVFLAVDSLENISKGLEYLNKSSIEMQAFEFLSEACVQLVEKYHPNVQFPLESRSAYYLLVDVVNASEEDVMDMFTDLSEKNIVVDGSIASSDAQRKNFWAIRENISESLSNQYFLKKEDISVPISQLADFCGELETLFKGNSLFELFLFGHIGDGNIHLNLISNDKEQTTESLTKASDDLLKNVWPLLKKYSGSPSAEHGIGLLKKDLLISFKSELSLSLMKKIKKQFDPDGILNPGKIFDA